MATLTGFLKDNEGLYIMKDEDAVLTYSLDWSDWLPTGTVITSNSFTVETLAGDTDALVKSSQSNTDTVATIKVSGGTSGKIYKVYNTITITGSLIERRYFRVKVTARSL
jgi:hypothetical protein